MILTLKINEILRRENREITVDLLELKSFVKLKCPIVDTKSYMHELQLYNSYNITTKHKLLHEY